MANHGDTPSDITLLAHQAARRNAVDADATNTLIHSNRLQAQPGTFHLRDKQDLFEAFSTDRFDVTVRVRASDYAGGLPKGTIVYIGGATGNRPYVLKASASTEATSSKTFGVLAEDIPANGDGLCAVNGLLTGLALPNSTYVEGDSLWLGTTAGTWTRNTPPAEPNHSVFIGWVTRVHPTDGKVALQIQNGFELDELHGVLISSVADGEVLTYESSSGLWKNKAGGASSPLTLQTYGSEPTINLQRANGTSGSPTAVLDTENYGVLYFKGRSDDGTTRTASYITVSADGTPSGSSMKGRLQFATSNTTNPLVRMTLQKNGNLTIGTQTDYSARLLSLATTEQLRLCYDASNYVSMTVASNGAITFDAVSGTSGQKFNFADDVDVAGGAVLQGSYLPTYRSSKIGTLTINNNTADDTVDFSQGIVFTDNTNTYGPWTHAGIVSVGSTGYNGGLVFGTDNDGFNNTSGIAERMRLTAAGKLGLGVTAPTAKLEVLRDDEQLRLCYDASNYVKLTVGSTGTATIDGGGSNKGFAFASGFKLGFFGKTATIQPTTLIAGATYSNNGTVDTDTWDGYTIGQVVAALRSLGLLA